jgi:hypothetical protein
MNAKQNINYTFDRGAVVAIPMDQLDWPGPARSAGPARLARPARPGCTSMFFKMFIGKHRIPYVIFKE